MPDRHHHRLKSISLGLQKTKPVYISNQATIKYLGTKDSGKTGKIAISTNRPRPVEVTSRNRLSALYQDLLAQLAAKS